MRIIAGKWRGSKLEFSDADGLRPTSDRIRETLFNWLANDIADASCLDLFAGSGVLSFEALSRGAEKVCALENNRVTCQKIGENKARLSAEGILLIQQQAADALLLDTDHDFSSAQVRFMPFQPKASAAACAA